MKRNPFQAGCRWLTVLWRWKVEADSENDV